MSASWGPALRYSDARNDPSSATASTINPTTTQNPTLMACIEPPRSGGLRPAAPLAWLTHCVRSLPLSHSITHSPTTALLLRRQVAPPPHGCDAALVRR